MGRQKQCKSGKVENSLFKIEDTQHAGRGLVAARQIRAGQLILLERAALLLETDDITEENINNKIQKLKPEIKEKFASLCPTKELAMNSTKFTCNAVNIDTNKFGLFLILAMVNHSCVPTAVWGSTECVDTLELRALTDISAGTEITVNYIGDKCLLMDPAERNKLLGQTWGFSCICPACQEDTDQAIRKLLGLLKNKMREKLCLEYFEELFKLHNQKLIAVQKMKAFNHQELLNCLQVHVLLSLFSCQPGPVVQGWLLSWEEVCARDGLLESRLAWEDLNKSFTAGVPSDRREFYEGDRVRREWIQWVYNKL